MGDWVMGDKVGGDKVLGDKNTYHHHPAAGTPSPERLPVLLMLSAGPADVPALGLDDERREIRYSIALVQGNGRLAVQIADAVRLDDLQPELVTHYPAVVHFSGHGAPGGVFVKDERGNARTVAPQALTDLFAIVRASVKCVVLNACFTDRQAAAIARHVPCVVGMAGPVLDSTAINFAGGFYMGLSAGRSVNESFLLGRNRLSLRELDERPPVLMAAPGVAETTYIVH